MVTPDGVSSPSEALDRRSLTAAAIRRGDVKISEPIPWETELPSSPSSSQRKPPTANIAVAQHRPEEVGAPKTNATVTQRGSDESPTHGRDADEGEDAPKSFEGAPLSQPLRHKTASLSMREDSEVQQRKRESGFTESPTDSPNQMQSKKKRRSGTGTIRTVFRRLFSKRERAGASRYIEDKKSASPRTRQHGYHRSVSLAVRAQDLQLIRFPGPSPQSFKSWSWRHQGVVSRQSERLSGRTDTGTSSERLSSEHASSAASTLSNECQRPSAR